jgi:ATP synthase I chain
MTSPPQSPNSAANFTDADFRQTMLAALRLLAVFAVVAAAIFWWFKGWPSAALVLTGAAISAASLWEWLRLMIAVNQRMDAGGTPRPMSMILLGFVLRLILTVVVLYGSLKLLHGTAFALLAGLGLGVLSLTIEALRLVKRWTA